MKKLGPQASEAQDDFQFGHPNRDATCLPESETWILRWLCLAGDELRMLLAMCPLLVTLCCCCHHLFEWFMIPWIP